VFSELMRCFLHGVYEVAEVRGEFAGEEKLTIFFFSFLGQSLSL